MEIIQAIANLGSALAWPILAAVALYKFRSDIGGLLARLRKGAGVEFDPPPQGTSGSAEGVSPSGPQNRPAMSPPIPRTAASIALEEQIKKVPQLGLSSPLGEREQMLLTMSARAFLIAAFERAEGLIWASQLDILNHLNLNPQGVPFSTLKQNFYDSAAKQHPDIFAKYPFEGYMTFLESNSLITSASGVASITDQGREYLSWRIEQRRPPKQAG